ncbi:hypothetical protein J4440_05265 [Candidatus Woesearchaeota archaeon]|nr:hypothetical protein [Candidatus Woesearchaeota archaeon]
MIYIEIWLHGKPGWALPIEGRNKINPLVLREYGDSLRKHINNVAFIIHRLQNHGWTINEPGLNPYSIEYYKEGVNKFNVYEELKKAGICAHDVAIRELIENE